MSVAGAAAERHPHARLPPPPPVRDLRVYSGPHRAGVYHYRDDTGLEADAVIERDDGTWIAIEVKLSPAAETADKAARSLLRRGGVGCVCACSTETADKAARSLLRLHAKTTPERAADLAALLVATATGAAYRRPDGVQVAPLNTLAS